MIEEILNIFLNKFDNAFKKMPNSQKKKSIAKSNLKAICNGIHNGQIYC